MTWSLNHLVANLICTVYEESEIAAMVECKMLPARPEFRFSHDSWLGVNAVSNFRLDSPIFGIPRAANATFESIASHPNGLAPSAVGPMMLGLRRPGADDVAPAGVNLGELYRDREDEVL
jgi:hypothetical protein